MLPEVRLVFASAPLTQNLQVSLLLILRSTLGFLADFGGVLGNMVRHETSDSCALYFPICGGISFVAQVYRDRLRQGRPTNGQFAVYHPPMWCIGLLPPKRCFLDFSGEYAWTDLGDLPPGNNNLNLGFDGLMLQPGTSRVIVSEARRALRAFGFARYWQGAPYHFFRKD